MTSKNKRKRSYDESFSKLGFAELNGKPKYVICLKILSEESMKKNKLRRHLTTNHSGCVDKPVEFFKHKLQSIASQKSVLTAFTEVNKSAVYSLYAWAYDLKPIWGGTKFLPEKFVTTITSPKKKKKRSSPVSLHLFHYFWRKYAIKRVSIHMLTFFFFFGDAIAVTNFSAEM